MLMNRGYLVAHIGWDLHCNEGECDRNFHEYNVAFLYADVMQYT